MTTTRAAGRTGFKIHYRPGTDGRADLYLANSTRKLRFAISDLHDSLLDLARLALALQAGDARARALFVIDPEEVALSLNIEDDTVHYRVERFDDWENPDHAATSIGKTLLAGKTGTDDLVDQVIDILQQARSSVEKPGQLHEFPAGLLEQLETNRDIAGGRNINRPLMAARLFLITAVTPPIYLAVSWIGSFLFSLYNLLWVPNLIAMLIAAESGWLIWKHTRAVQTLTGKSRALAIGLYLGAGTGVAAGFYLAMLYRPNDLLYPVYAALAAGLAGVIAGAILALLGWKIFSRSG